MTTTVKVTAHCAENKHVRIQRTGPGYDGVDTFIKNGEVNEQVVYDGLVIAVREELRPVLTEADAAADLAGTPRPPPDMTFGQKAVCFTFNPGGMLAVSEAKAAFAKCIDLMNGLRTTTENPEIKRMASVAITEAQTAQMWAVKAITWQK